MGIPFQPPTTVETPQLRSSQRRPGGKSNSERLETWNAVVATCLRIKNIKKKQRKIQSNVFCKGMLICLLKINIPIKAPFKKVSYLFSQKDQSLKNYEF